MIKDSHYKFHDDQFIEVEDDDAFIENSNNRCDNLGLSM